MATTCAPLSDPNTSALAPHFPTGTTFDIPRAELLYGPGFAAPTQNARTGRTVLLIDDEDGLRGLLEIILGQKGYRILSAGDYESGLESARKEARVDFIVSDIFLRQRSGPALVAEVKALHPDARVIFMSGDTDSLEDNTGFKRANTVILQKPFESAQLLAALS